MKRRNFLRNLGWAGAVSAVPVTLVNAAVPSAAIPDLSTTMLTGRVLANSIGIANVAVTDGTNIVLTDSSGKYKLLSNKTAQFVYLSVPAGYEFPHEKHIAKFYQKIDHSGFEFQFDFELQALKADDSHHAFVVWADPQTISKEDIELMKAQTVPDLKALKESLPNNFPFHAIGCGDLVWDHFELYPDYKEAADMTGVTFFNVIGNHDMDLTARSDEQSSVTFREQFGPTYYSYNRGKVHYITLDDVFYIGMKKSYIGYLSENQFQWLEQDLKNVSKDTLIVISIHIPSNTGMQRRLNEKKEELGGTMANRERLYDLLRPFNKVHIMSGHTHFNEVWIDGNITEHVHGTVCGAWWSGPICGDGTPNGYGVYEVKGNNLEWYYKSTGSPKTYQLKIYPKNFENVPNGEICVNVWNWDESWKVEWVEDGVKKGLMERRTGLDPWAIQLYAGKKLPQKHPFVEPVPTDHLFYCKPSSTAKKIRVMATDPFGQVYSDEIAL